MDLLPAKAAVIPVGLHWFGGWNFNIQHPVFEGLLAPIVFGQEFFSAFAYWGISNFQGSLIAGMINAPLQLAATIGEFPVEKGKIIVCALAWSPISTEAQWRIASWHNS